MQAQALAGCHSQGIVASMASLLEKKRRMKRILAKRGEGFFAWWAEFPREKREEFIQEVCRAPPPIQSKSVCGAGRRSNAVPRSISWLTGRSTKSFAGSLPCMLGGA